MAADVHRFGPCADFVIEIGPEIIAQRELLDGKRRVVSAVGLELRNWLATIHECHNLKGLNRCFGTSLGTLVGIKWVSGRYQAGVRRMEERANHTRYGDTEYGIRRGTHLMGIMMSHVDPHAPDRAVVARHAPVVPVVLDKRQHDVVVELVIPNFARHEIEKR